MIIMDNRLKGYIVYLNQMSTTSDVLCEYKSSRQVASLPLVISLNRKIPEYDLWKSATFPCIDSFNFTSSNESSSSLSTPYTSSGSDPMSCDSSDDSHSDKSSVPTMELISSHKRLNLTPSCFINGCVCGHNFEFRDMVHENRSRRLIHGCGITIRPKVPPINTKFRSIC